MSLLQDCLALPTHPVVLQIVDDAIGAGVDGYDADMKAAVRNGFTGLRLTEESAMEIASKAVSLL